MKVTIPYTETGLVSLNRRFTGDDPRDLEVDIPKLEKLLAAAKAEAKKQQVPSFDIVLGRNEHFSIGAVIRIEKRFQHLGQLYTYVALKVSDNYWISSAKAVEGTGTFDQVFGNIWRDAKHIAISTELF